MAAPKHLSAGYVEIPHTADWALRVWAPDLPSLLLQAAQGMYALAGLRLGEEERVDRSLTLTAPDAESLLVRFLSELLYFAEQANLAFDDMTLELECRAEGYVLRGRLRGVPIRALTKAIKAVTFHNLKIRSTGQGMETVIVFDV